MFYAGHWIEMQNLETYSSFAIREGLPVIILPDVNNMHVDSAEFAWRSDRCNSF